MITTAPATPEAPLTHLRGAPASPGSATGRARIVRATQDAELLQPGEILVCATLTPSMAPLLSRASGIIAEHGGALSNAATLAREHGIPAVVAAHDATTRIRDGQLVTIDGTNGIVSQPA